MPFLLHQRDVVVERHQFTGLAAHTLFASEKRTFVLDAIAQQDVVDLAFERQRVEADRREFCQPRVVESPEAFAPRRGALNRVEALNGLADPG